MSKHQPKSLEGWHQYKLQHEGDVGFVNSNQGEVWAPPPSKLEPWQLTPAGKLRPLCGNLRFGLVDASNLQIPGKSDEPDTFISIFTDQNGKLIKKANTDPRFKTKNPSWFEYYDISVDYGRFAFVSVRQPARFKLGKGEEFASGLVDLLPISNGSEHDVHLKLHPTGELYLKLHFTDESGMFGLDINSLVKRERRIYLNTPTIVEMCVEHINANGLDNVGMYRLCGSASAVETLKKRFNHSSSPATVKFGDEGNDINNIGSLLKLYLRELPEPLIPFARYFDCIAAIQMDETTEMIEKLTKFKEIIHTLPTVNRATIIYLLNHLYRLAQRSTENKMTPRNLGTCFGPSLLASPPVTTSKKLRTGAVSIAVSPASASITALSETMQIGLQAKVVEFMIENWHELSIPPTQSELRALPSIRETLRKRSGSRLASASASPSPASPTTTTSSSSPSSSGFLSPVPAPASASASISAPSPEPVSASSLSISLSESLPETTFRDEEAAAAGKKGSLKNKHVLSLPGSASPSSPTQSSTPPISSPLSKEGNIDSISLHLFLKHDKDNSKVLEPHEFVNLCSELGLSNEKSVELLKTFDRDGDGNISYDEFVKLVDLIDLAVTMEEVYTKERKPKGVGMTAASKLETILDPEHPAVSVSPLTPAMESHYNLEEDSTEGGYMDSSSTVRKLFLKYDEDGSGSINASELGKLLYDAGYLLSEEELNFAVQRLADSDGEISFDAFTEFWSSDDKFKSLHLDGDQLEHVHRASTYFQYFDEDGNGTLSKDEFYKLYEDLSNYGLLLPSVEDCFDELDADKSGSITFNEYIQWLIKTQAINVGTAV